MEGKFYVFWIMLRGNRGCFFFDKLIVNFIFVVDKYMYMYVVKNDLGRYGKC